MQTLTRILAKDIMRTDVATLRPEDTLESAIELFEEMHIARAPVVDGAGALVGVLSASDIARFNREKGRGRARTEERPEALEDELSEEEGLFEVDAYSEELLGSERVCDWMTARVITARPESTLRELCKLMSREAVHRVVIANGRQLVGLVTSFDVVRCVAENA